MRFLLSRSAVIKHFGHYTSQELRSAHRKSKAIHDAHHDSGADLSRTDGDELPERPARVTSAKEKRRSLSMHEGIAVWCDCCSCEAEPDAENAG
jgi:hypothetical protein